MKVVTEFHVTGRTQVGLLKAAIAQWRQLTDSTDTSLPEDAEIYVSRSEASHTVTGDAALPEWEALVTVHQEI